MSRKRPTAEEARRQRLADLNIDGHAIETQRVERCNLCGGTVFIQLARVDRYGLPMRTQFCDACGLIFLDPQPTPAAYARFYDGDYRRLIAAHSGRPDDPAKRARARVAYARSIDDNLIGRHLGPQHRTLLDLGASSGEVAAHFVQHHGLEATCLEPAPAEAEAARAQGLDVHTTTAEAFDPGGRRFDVILLCKTVDHLTDIAGVLARVHQWLSDDGLFFVDPVDVFAIWRAHRGLVGGLKIDHPYYLTRETMTLYLTRAGFTPIALDISGNPFHIDFLCRKTTPAPQPPDPAVAQRLYRRIRAFQTRDRHPKPPPPPDTVLRIARKVRGMIER